MRRSSITEVTPGVAPGVAPSPARRVLDLVVSAAALLLLSPMILVVALAVKLTSAGPVLFRQVRVGQGGRPFTLYKFRTMRPGTRGPEVTRGDDPRVTRVGKLLRTTGIDELPQFFNVLRGDMTLVGPRPETPSLADRYPAGCQVVFAHRPGLTGPTQVRLRDKDVLPPAGVADLEGYYLRELVPTRVALDFSYLDDPSLAHTVAMLWRTAVYVLRGSPAARSRARQAPQPAPGRPSGLSALGRDGELSGLEVRPVEVRAGKANDPRP
jgi:lipopolysaccharide/colanic/teichoic acid biosynthesis glycosyltransferase